MNNLDRSLSDIIGTNYGPKRSNRTGRRNTPYGSNSGGAGTRVYVGNLPYSASWQEVKDKCKEFGFVKKVDIAENSNGDSKGFAIAIFGNAKDARACIEGLQGQELGGRELHVKSDSRPSTTGRHTGRRNSGNYSNKFNDNNFMNNPMAKNMMQMMVSSMMGTMMGNMMGNNNRKVGRHTLSLPTQTQNRMKQTQSFSPKSSGTSVFIGNLPWSTSWQDLKHLCKDYGFVTRTDISEEDGRSKGYGIAVFKTRKDALNCVAELDGYELDGRELNVHLDTKGNRQESKNSYVGNPTSVYVGNLPFSTSWQDLKDMCKSFGDVSHVDIQENDEGRSKGFAIVKFGSANSARDCVANLNGQSFEGRDLTVHLDKFSGGGGKSVYVGNLPYSCSWKELKDLCKSFGDVVRADIEEREDGSSKGFGIVSFSNAADTQNCIANLNGELLDGRELHVRLDHES